MFKATVMALCVLALASAAWASDVITIASDGNDYTGFTLVVIGKVDGDFDGCGGLQNARKVLVIPKGGRATILVVGFDTKPKPGDRFLVNGQNVCPTDPTKVQLFLQPI